MDLLQKARQLAAISHSEQHPWVSLDDDELIRAARLWSRDAETGEEGFTLAAILITGSDDLIFDVLPAYRTEALLRRNDSERYDDRATIRTNLIDAYDELLAFGKKWLPEAFALDGAQRVNPQDVIIRELVSNTLMHREYSSPHTAKLEIGRGYVATRNASRSVYTHPVTLDNFDPTPKNPVIANFFVQIGRSESLGSGTRKLYKYSRLYTGEEPSLVDGDFFDARVPVPDVMPAEQPAVSPTTRPSNTMKEKIVELMSQADTVTTAEIASKLGLSTRTASRRIGELIEEGVVKQEGKGPKTRYKLNQVAVLP